MLQQLHQWGDKWHDHHRRFMDDSSILRQILELVVMLTVLIMILTLLP